MPVFREIANILDLHLQGKKFESSMIIKFICEYLEMVTNKQNIAFANR